MFSFREYVQRRDEGFIGKLKGAAKGIATGALDMAVGPEMGIDNEKLLMSLQTMPAAMPIAKQILVGSGKSGKKHGPRRVHTPLKFPGGKLY